MIDVSEVIDVNKTIDLCVRDICHYWYSLKINFRIQPKVCNGSHDLTQKAVNFNDAAFFSVKGNDYTFHFFNISTDEAVNLSRNTDLTEKKQNFIKYNFSLSCIK